MFCYHATTSSRVDTILNEGLIPRCESPLRDYEPRIYLCTSLGGCLMYINIYNAYSEEHPKLFPERAFSILEVYIRDRDLGKLLPDLECEKKADAFYLTESIHSKDVQFMYDHFNF